MTNPLFWILERLYYPKGTAMPIEDYPENTFYSYTGELPKVDEYNDSAYFHEQLDEILAELRKLVKNTTPKNPHPRDVGPTVLREDDPVLDAKTVRKLAKNYIYGEYNPRVSAKILGDWPGEPEIDPAAFTNIVRGSN